MRHLSFPVRGAILCGAVAGALLAFRAPVTAARDSDDGTAGVAPRRDIVITDGDQTCTVRMEDGPRIRIIGADGDEEVITIDAAAIAKAVGDAMAEVGDALSELGDVQVEDLGHGVVAIRSEGETTTIDVEAILREVREALADVQVEIGRDLDREFGGRDGASDADAARRRESLREEMNDLRREIDDLRSDLARLRERGDRSRP